VQAQINNLTKARTANQSALQRNVAALAKTTTGSPARALAEQRVQAATTEASKLESQISDLRLFQGDPGQVLSPATVPTGAAGLPGWIMPAAGAALGLLLGLVFAIWRSLNDRTLRTADDVKALGYPVLSTVTTTAAEHPELLLSDVAAELPEGARLLRSVLGVTSPDGGAVLLVPAGAVESHTTTPLVLAAALARADQSVTLVDTDGELTRVAQLTSIKGLSEVLSDGAQAYEVAREYQPGLRFVPVGIQHSGSVDKLASPQMRTFLDMLVPGSRWLLVAGPIASAPETLTLADLCTDVVILVSLGRTTSAELQHAAEAVTRGGAKLAGIVLDSPEEHGLFHRSTHESKHDQNDSPAVVETVPSPPTAAAKRAAGATGAAAAAPVVLSVDAQTEELPKIDAPLPSATNGSALNGSALNGTALNGTPKNGVAANDTAASGTAANGTAANGTAANGSPAASPDQVTPAATPWFQDAGDDSDDLASSRRRM
jgi:MinD-like ATPase involved in chromosome partitioning or flagellar assembly